jgi:hypothetical protein
MISRKEERAMYEAETARLRARVVKLRVALSIRNAEVDALEERVAELKAPRYLATELEKTND